MIFKYMIMEHKIPCLGTITVKGLKKMKLTSKLDTTNVVAYTVHC